ncbi:toll/interleukin-1 receptor domain-containing protein [Luteolibacter algae]|uniref:Toll/interleukin-1 receptor domain-containing protein n=1 Tax=Luteolibacter algae TaxID=454151 RepID=A0ABW5D707_9BACT
MKSTLGDVFVSYSSPDLRAARQFADWITKAGMTARLIEPGEGGGKSFPAAMGEAIEKCDRLLAVYTRHYKNSGACTAEMEGMWRRDPDGKLGRILIVRLDDTEVPALFATRDYWDFTKILVEDVKGEFLRRLQTLEPIRPRRKVAKGKKAAPTPELATPDSASSPGMNMNVSGTGHRINQAGGDIHETHYHTPKPPALALHFRRRIPPRYGTSRPRNRPD